MGLALLALGLLVARVAGPWAGVATAARHRHPLPGAAHRAGDLLRAAGDAHRDGRAARGHAVAVAVGAGAWPAGSCAGGRLGGPGSWVTPRRRGWSWGGRRFARCCCTTRRRGPGCWPVCSSVAPGWCGSTPCARSCCCCRCWPWGRRSVARWPRPVLRRAGGVAARVGRRRRGAVVAVPRVDRREPGAAAGARACSSAAARGSCSCCGGAAGGCRRSWVAGCPNVAAGLVVVVGLYLAGRPLWQVVRQDPNDPGSRYVAGMQARQGLPVDGGRTYAEQTVAWLSWYVGPVALVVALAVLAVLVRRAVLSAESRRVDAWLPALLVASGSTLLTLAAARHHAGPPVGRPPAAHRAAPGGGARHDRAGVGRAADQGRGPGVGGRGAARASSRRPWSFRPWSPRGRTAPEASSAGRSRPCESVCDALRPATS